MIQPVEHLTARPLGYLASSPHRAALKVVPACYRTRGYGDSFVSWRYLARVLLAIWRELRRRWPSLRYSPRIPPCNRILRGVMRFLATYHGLEIVIQGTSDCPDRGNAMTYYRLVATGGLPRYPLRTGYSSGVTYYRLALRPPAA